MTTLNQFESAFARADKVEFQLAPRPIRRILFLSDLDDEQTETSLEQLKVFLGVLSDAPDEDPEWLSLSASQYANGQEVLEKLEDLKPDLIVTYRMLKEISRELAYSLGTYLDVLSQAISTPILVIPRDATLMNLSEGTPQVLAVTSHMTGDDSLVNWALPFVRGAKGDLFLAHIEDDHDFERYLDVIGKIPDLNTEIARSEIQAQLLKEATEFIASAKAAINAANPDLQVHSLVRLGHKVPDYVALVAEHKVDLLVIEGKDESQAAMSGLAYSLAIELGSLPILIL
ncbi:MAG: hypothetical protein JKY65_17290 [Planctomycetes bacterium]|nr:hypothetical protein [Planctomycetota bacterium]